MLFFVIALSLQTQDFAAVSVRPSTGQQPMFGKVEFLPGGRFVAANAGLRQIVNAAYGMTGRARVVKGGNLPSWFDSNRFDIQAVAEEGSSPSVQQIRGMLQRMLADRFKMAVRPQVAEMRCFIVRVSGSGAKLKESTLDCLDQPRQCGTFSGNHFRDGMRGDAVTIADLAFQIETIGDLPVVDETGLTGRYAIQLRPFKSLRAFLNDFPGSERAPAQPDASLFEVLEKDLGLMLQTGRARIQQLVIESIERPAEN